MPTLTTPSTFIPTLPTVTYQLTSGEVVYALWGSGAISDIEVGVIRAANEAYLASKRTREDLLRLHTARVMAAGWVLTRLGHPAARRAARAG